MTLTMHYKKSTPNTHVYECEVEDGLLKGLQTLYLKKESVVFDNPEHLVAPPKEIEVAVVVKG